MFRVLPFLLISLFAFLALSCSEKPEDAGAYRASLQLDEAGAQALMTSVIRYAGRLPAGATIQTRYEARFDADYAETAAEHRIDYFYRSPDDRIFMVISRDARSLHSRRLATGIELIPGDSLSARPLAYAEHFRTWAMAPDELDRKAGELFLLMKAGADLSPFYPENSRDEEYIEFPNAEVRFDTHTRSWVRDEPHPLDTLRELRNQQ